jgi:hypothetical protein
MLHPIYTVLHYSDTVPRVVLPREIKGSHLRPSVCRECSENGSGNTLGNIRPMMPAAVGPCKLWPMIGHQDSVAVAKSYRQGDPLPSHSRRRCPAESRSAGAGNPMRAYRPRRYGRSGRPPTALFAAHTRAPRPPFPPLQEVQRNQQRDGEVGGRSRSRRKVCPRGAPLRRRKTIQTPRALRALGLLSISLRTVPSFRCQDGQRRPCDG